MTICTTLFSDRTFESAPNLLYQLYIFFGVVGDQKLPLSWVFLKNRTTETFIENFIEKILQSMATEIVCTFEFGFKSAKKRKTCKS